MKTMILAAAAAIALTTGVIAQQTALPSGVTVSDQPWILADRRCVAADLRVDDATGLVRPTFRWQPIETGRLYEPIDQRCDLRGQIADSAVDKKGDKVPN